MILSHTNALEKVLIAQSSAAANAGHPNLRGGPREWFIRDFLQNHLPGNLDIGQGEIIDEDSEPRVRPDEYRPQVDIVIYRRDFPRISYSRDNAAFLVEGVVATIESKSTLTKPLLNRACEVAAEHKNLKRTPPLHAFGVPSLPIQSYVVAYDSETSIPTIVTWLPQIGAELKISDEQMVDLIVILGKGVIWKPSAFASVPALAPAGARWAFFTQGERNLFMLFMHMLTWMPHLSVPPSALGYVSGVLFESYGTV